MSIIRLPSWQTAVVASLAAALLTSDNQSRLLSLAKKAFALLLVLNWRALPLIWTRGEDKAMAIARDPYEVRTRTTGRVGWADTDYNVHMSNSSYARVCDRARFRWLLELVGPAMGMGIWSPLAATSFSFFKEIPAGADYEIDVHLVSYDDKWVRVHSARSALEHFDPRSKKSSQIYYVARFTTAPRKGSKERTLNAVAFSRSCFKLRGSRLSIPPSRVLSLSGVGPDRSNWNRTLKLQKEKKVRKWIQFGAERVAQKNGKWTNGAMVAGEEGWEDDGLSMYEEKRLKGLPVAQRFGDVTGWEEL
ncbi:SPOSA6832_01674 [Sporobolomyces salmonicolor]|uniref:SPOSA6832_01674-mRNA-1:cds n=1 Tax=Sporidiobolus salmonicolor TaxID=5005 RepID=A0A0D6EKC2_SPOSA|nr:SPOSA6832_01674 [Sporobolomyces salmonicolor]